jgi:hypothetical protein
MSEIEFSDSSFIIGEYIPKELCDELIDFFKYSKKYVKPGVVGTPEENKKWIVDESVKQSLDLNISPGNFDTVIGEYRYHNDKVLKKYLKKFEHADKVESFNIRTYYNIQYYPIGGDFKQWHCENDGRNLEVMARHLVFMTYLNDVPDGGTEFYYQGIKTEAKKGLTLIWPAGWTHFHRGIISNTKEKYIITGWYSFNYG